MDYEKIYNKLCSSRKKRGLGKEKGYEIHHIKPRSMGGGEKSSNLVKLTYREHFIAHRLLFKIAKGSDKRSMYFAIKMMSGIDRYVNGRLYETLKRSLLSFEESLPEGVYFINPSVLPFDSLEELLGRLTYLGHLFFTLPRSRKFYKNGDFNTINKYTNKLLSEGVIEKYGKWGTYDLYQINKNNFTTISSDYTKTSIIYTNDIYGHEKEHKYLCWFNGVGFKNPPTNSKSKLNTKILEHYEGIRVSNVQEPYNYLVKGDLKNENREDIIDNYNKFRNKVRNTRQKLSLDFLVDIYNALVKYRSVGIPNSQRGQLGFDVKVRNRIFTFLCEYLNASYFESVKLVGGGMSIPVIKLNDVIS